MKQITIRKVSERGILLAKKAAQEKGTSLNTILVEAVETGLGIRGERPFNGLEIFSGDSDFGDDWEKYLTEDLGQIDGEIWR